MPAGMSAGRLCPRNMPDDGAACCELVDAASLHRGPRATALGLDSLKDDY